VRVELRDLNVMLALCDPAHVHHEVASQWFATSAQQGWATCPLTENGFVRILSTPTYPGIRLSPADGILLLETLVQNHAATHHFWPDSATFRDSTLFQSAAIAGPKQLIDIYLLGLCQQNGGTLVTLDARIITSAIGSPDADLLHVLTP